jgi:hypothetical protein
VLTNLICIPGTLDRAENVLFALTVFATPESGYRSKATGPASTRPIWGKGSTNLQLDYVKDRTGIALLVYAEMWNALSSSSSRRTLNVL